MRFLLMVHGDEREWDAISAEEQRAARDRYAAFARRARERGALLRAGELQPTDRATTVRVRDGETIVTDGPYAETAQALGRYFLVEADSIHDAVALAQELPPTEGGVEVRPVYEAGGGDAS